MAFIPMLAKGLLSYLPGTRGLFSRRSGGSCSARYCYSVWLRHLCMAYQQGLLKVGMPRFVAEIGPGDSLGIGIAALMSGCESYRAFDVVRSASTLENIAIFDELSELFESQADIPGDVEFPLISPRLSSYLFPSDILPTARLQVLLNQQRLKAIRDALKEMGPNGKQSEFISYTVPWSTLSEHNESTLDMIFSQAVMEHVEDLHNSYHAMFRWLKPGGFMSHQIDFSSHNVSNIWNKQWSYDRWVWALIKGRRPFLQNRHPLSVHENIMKQCGFNIVGKVTKEDKNGIRLDDLAKDFLDMSDKDFITRGAYVLAIKPSASTSAP